ncbi:DM13 domain-containing protein [Candidatus Microgenomates bacterium]|nr:DM13 domain-containing protein [Candidatus Microgenomates bacterium]
MLKYAFVLVLVFGVTAFVVRNVYFEGVKQIPQKKSVAQLQKTSTERELFRGQFKGTDSIHNVVGDAVVIQTSQGPVLRFEKFSSTPGPDLVVYLAKNDNVIFIKDLGNQPVTLGSLHKINGEQTYTLPEKYTDYQSVVILSRAFSILFGAAPIK